MNPSTRYWELRRIAYNLVLSAVVVVWVVSTWPHFREALTLPSLGKLLVLAALANVVYSAVYLVDIPLQQSSVAATWHRWRFGLWLAGTLLAFLFENYWIADEIYPYVR
jgi:hypothetical protein